MCVYVCVFAIYKFQQCYATQGIGLLNDYLPTYGFAIPNTGRFVMYSGITKIYYRETVGHEFTKPVHIEGTTKKKKFSH